MESLASEEASVSLAPPPESAFDDPPAGPAARISLHGGSAVVQGFDRRSRLFAHLVDAHDDLIASLSQPPAQASGETRTRVGQAIGPSIPQILASLSARSPNRHVRLLGGLNPAYLEALFTLPPEGCFTPALQKVPVAPTAPVTARGKRSELVLDPIALGAVFRPPAEGALAEWFKTGKIQLPPIIAGSASSTIDPIILDRRRAVFVCREQPSDVCYLVLVRIEPSRLSAEAILFDDGESGLLPTFKRAPDRTHEIDYFIRRLALTVLQHGDRLLRWLEAPDKKLALILHNGEKAHLGHFIWNEMFSLEQVVASAPEPPAIYAPARSIDTWFYGPVEDLYPEVSGTVVPVPSEAEALRHALHTNNAIIPGFGSRSLLASRRRIQAALRRDRDLRLAEEAVRAFAVDPRSGDRRPVVAFSLRLQNRTLEDPAAFFSDCAGAIADRFGSVGILIDGLNRVVGQPGGESFKLHNGGLGSERVAAGSQTTQLIDREHALADAVAAATAGRNVEVRSLVGTTMRPNLQWLDGADYFVGFQGAGLAKLRWALDKPGYVLTSRVNLLACGHLHIYDKAPYMEPIEAPLVMNGLDAVQDLTATPDPPPKTGIPHPTNFRLVDPSATIADIIAHLEPAFLRES